MILKITKLFPKMKEDLSCIIHSQREVCTNIRLEKGLYKNFVNHFLSPLSYKNKKTILFRNYISTYYKPFNF